MAEMNEQIKTKEEEINILWNVIKEINKTKGSEKINLSELRGLVEKGNYTSA